MNLGSILKGGVGFLTGGWPGAAIGLLGGSSGGQPQAQQGYTPPAASPLSEYLKRQAFLRGYQEVMQGQPAQETYSTQGALQRAGLPRQANQAGGQISRGAGSGAGKGAGGSSSEGRGAGTLPPWNQGLNPGFSYPNTPTPKAEAPAAPAPDPLANLYGAYLSRGLAGVGGLPANVYQGAMAQGLGTINRQALQSQQNLMGQMGSRGLLRSGIMGSGMADIERGRMGAVGGFSQALTEQNLAAARQAQQRAAELFVTGRESEAERQLRARLQGQQIEAAQPNWLDYAMQGMGAWTQLQNQPQTGLPMDILQQMWSPGGYNVPGGTIESAY